MHIGEEVGGNNYTDRTFIYSSWQLQGVSQTSIHFSIGNIFVNPGETAKPNISLDT